VPGSAGHGWRQLCRDEMSQAHKARGAAVWRAFDDEARITAQARSWAT
jgi:hypothetical protein